ncbi:MAG TPA: hypothetical protein VGO13_01270 [Solirubrobacterales bacterium]|nr:hypothetical protein [Solirubrobacterales bacterium]
MAWLTTTLKRRCWAINRSRRLDRRAGQWIDRDSGEPCFSIADPPPKTVSVEEGVERAEYVLEVRERLSALKPAERRVLVLIAAGCTYCEIGQITGFTYTKTNRSAAEDRASRRHAEPGGEQTLRGSAMLPSSMARSRPLDLRARATPGQHEVRK